MTHPHRLHILDVGHGNCAVLVDDAGVVVIDAGPNNTLLEFLLQENIRHVRLVLISHADADHIRGLLALVASEYVTIGGIYLNSDAQKDSVLWEELLYTLNLLHHPPETTFRSSLHVGMDKELAGGRVQIEILAPSFYLATLGPGATDRKGNRLTSNTVSAVIRLSQDSQPLALFPGDIDDVALDYLLGDVPDPYAPIAVFPHHGGRPGAGQPGPFADKFARAVHPTVILFSTGRGSSSKNPRKDVVSAVQAALPEVRLACTQLSKHCDTRATFPTHHLTSMFASGRAQRISCAGSMFIDLDANPFELHPLTQHKAFVAAYVATPLCRKQDAAPVATLDFLP